MVSNAINNKFDEWQLRGVSFGRGKFSSLKHHKPNLLLIAQQTMRLLVNRQLILIAIVLKASHLKKPVIKDLKVLS